MSLAGTSLPKIPVNQSMEGLHFGPCLGSTVRHSCFHCICIRPTASEVSVRCQNWTGSYRWGINRTPPPQLQRSFCHWFWRFRQSRCQSRCWRIKVLLPVLVTIIPHKRRGRREPPTPTPPPFLLHSHGGRGHPLQYSFVKFPASPHF